MLSEILAVKVEQVKSVKGDRGVTVSIAQAVKARDTNVIKCHDQKMKLESKSTFWLLALLLAGVIALPVWVGNAKNSSVAINIDAAANQHAIDPNIYGVAFATTLQLSDLNCPLHRSGGNATSQYNWQLNCDNRGSDWYFESIASGGPTGQAQRRFYLQLKSCRRAADVDYSDDRLGRQAWFEPE